MLIGRSPAFVRTMQLLDRFGTCTAPVLIEGETGTGKELAARHVHYGGTRRSGPFVPINCGAIPEALLENELFGHGRGAFTDAGGESVGCIGLAQGGTLFLDEIDSLPPRGQVALLRFLQDSTYRPLGGREEQRADVRVITASNAGLEALCDRGTFRRDLLFRIKLLFLEMPPLRRRPGDPALLAAHFLADCSRRYGAPPKRLDPAAGAWVEAHDWPGNVRELENLIHRACLLCDGPEISPQDLGAETGAASSGAGTAATAYRTARARAVEEFHRRYLMELLREVGGNLSSAARRSGADRRMLGRLIKRYKIDSSSFRLA
jgi:two-component system, NtrC family, response regulator GlrR